uniref:Si:dkeyp-23e4.3 n=1 Tax=Amphiprion percula TaxID=161767 RepID=A0A3P8S9I8_AMPPE
TISSGSSSNSQSESSSTVSTPSPVTRVRSNCKRSNSGVGDGTSRNNQNHGLVFQIPHGHKPGTFPTSLMDKHAILSPIIDSTSVNWRTGSFHGYRARNSCRRGTSSLASPSSSCDVPSPLTLLDHRMSVYDNVPDDRHRLLAGEDVFLALDSVLERISNLQQLVSTWSENLSEDDCQRGSSSSSSHIHLEVQHPEESSEKTPVNGEESKTTSPHQQLHWSSEQSLPSLPSSPGVENQSASQFLLLQKLSLLKLTALMDKYSPSSKQGWNWTVPKPLRKTKAMEVKGRRVFGGPLLLGVQQTGDPLPPSILRALVYLRTECLDQVGLFRKSGVKSRIQYLREMVESDPDGVSYDGQSAFDVADMVKQYFRDLPEPIFTSKLSESFLHIYQYFPKDQQLVAAQAAILLLPDENREALRTLLFFLRDVVSCVDENQMTPTNIAVCLAPSLFHLNTLKRDANAARSSHRKYSLGRPDQRDLSENLAATQGLASMITEAQRLFQVPPACYKRKKKQKKNSTLNGGSEEDQQEERRKKLQLSTQILLKEAREKSRGWENHPAPENVEVAFKKMDDGCPLWTWRGSVEVDAPQIELLHRLLREQQLWEGNLRHCQLSITEILKQKNQTFRSCLEWWQADPSSGPLFLSSVSTDHPEVLVDGVRVHVHGCLYLLEPTGARKTRLTHLCRTDTRIIRTTVYLHLCSWSLVRPSQLVKDGGFVLRRELDFCCSHVSFKSFP